MAESERRQNPFEKLKQKVVNPVQSSSNNNKRIQMQKVDNFRDQLNKQLFGESDDSAANTFNTPNPVSNPVPNPVSNPISPNPDVQKKEYKVPPKVFKRPEIQLPNAASSKVGNAEDIFGVSDVKSTKSNKTEPITTNNNNNEVQINNHNISFSEDNCSSVVYSENKLDVPSETSSNDKKPIAPISDFSTINKESLNNQIAEVNKPDTNKITLEEEIPSNNDHEEEGIQPSGLVEDNYQHNPSDPTQSNTNAYNVSFTSSELSKKLDKLKNEIRELKRSKSTLEANYYIEVNKNKLYENEIEDLRKCVTQYKMKEINEGETMLKLEIDNIKNSLEFRKKENDLLQKENSSLSLEVKKLQNYIKEMLNVEEGFLQHKEEDSKDEVAEERVSQSKEVFKENVQENIHIVDEIVTDIIFSNVIMNQPKHEEEEEEVVEEKETSATHETHVIPDQKEEEDVEQTEQAEENIIPSKSEQIKEPEAEILDRQEENLKTIFTNEPTTIESPISQKIASVSNKNIPEKNLFEELTSDVNDVFSVSSGIKQTSQRGNQPPHRAALYRKNESPKPDNMNKQTKPPTNVSITKKPLTVDKQDKKMNAFAFDLHDHNDDEDDIGTIFGNLTKTKNKAEEANSSLFD